MRPVEVHRTSILISEENFAFAFPVMSERCEGVSVWELHWFGVGVCMFKYGGNCLTEITATMACANVLAQDRTQLLLDKEGLDVIRSISGPVVPVVVIGASCTLLPPAHGHP